MNSKSGLGTMITEGFLRSKVHQIIVETLAVVLRHRYRPSRDLLCNLRLDAGITEAIWQLAFNDNTKNILLEVLCYHRSGMTETSVPHLCSSCCDMWIVRCGRIASYISRRSAYVTSGVVRKWWLHAEKVVPMIVCDLPSRSPIRITGNKPVGTMVPNDAFAFDNIHGDNVSQEIRQQQSVVQGNNTLCAIPLHADDMDSAIALNK